MAKSKAFKKEQDKIKRWFEKGFTAVYKKDCPMCGNVFYALFNNQIACPNGICDDKLKSMLNSNCEFLEKQRISFNGTSELLQVKEMK